MSLVVAIWISEAGIGYDLAKHGIGPWILSLILIAVLSFVLLHVDKK